MGLSEALLRRLQLAGAAVDQQQIRAWQIAGHDPRSVPRQCLFQGSVVIAGAHTLDVVAPIGTFECALRAKHHTSGHRALAPGVADIEAIDALGRAWQI